MSDKEAEEIAEKWIDIVGLADRDLGKLAFDDLSKVNYRNFGSAKALARRQTALAGPVEAPPLNC